VQCITNFVRSAGKGLAAAPPTLQGHAVTPAGSDALQSHATIDGRLSSGGPVQVLFLP
jgi:hypothetical protein